MSKGDYPIGAAEDKAAPYNEIEGVPIKRFVSVSLSYYDTINVPIGTNEEDIQLLIKSRIDNGIFPEEFNIDEVVILND